MFNRVLVALMLASFIAGLLIVFLGSPEVAAYGFVLVLVSSYLQDILLYGLISDEVVDMRQRVTILAVLFTTAMFHYAMAYLAFYHANHEHFTISEAVKRSLEAGNAQISDIPKLGLVEGIYLSTTILTTVGFGDITPNSKVTRLLVVTEELYGVFFIGYAFLFLWPVVDTTRRSRESPGVSQE